MLMRDLVDGGIGGAADGHRVGDDFAVLRVPFGGDDLSHGTGRHDQFRLGGGAHAATVQMHAETLVGLTDPGLFPEAFRGPFAHAGALQISSINPARSRKSRAIAVAAPNASGL